MRFGALFLAVLGAALLSAPEVRADDGPLPPPKVIKRSRGTPATAPGSTRTPAPAASRPAATLPPIQPTRPVQPSRPSAPIDSTGSAPAGMAPVPDPGGSLQPAPVPITQREIARRIDAYLGDDEPLFAPTGMPGIAGYDGGFRWRTGGFRLALNMILQARYEAFLFDDTKPAPGGDLSGFSLPRAVLRLSGTSEPNFRYFLELDFGNHGGPRAWRDFRNCINCTTDNLGPDSQTETFDPLREAWIEWNPVNVINIRGGLFRTPAPRQLMVQPELQQFTDISLASAWMGLGMPGYSDRNRDYGVMVHGTYGPREQFSYMLAVTNGDGGDHVRNVIDQRSSDNLAYSARVNYAFLNAIGFQEGALRQRTNTWYGEAGLWAFYYADRLDLPHTTEGDYLRYGLDVALGYGGWSFTGGFSWTDDQDVLGANNDDSTAWLAQLGHHFVGTPLELAARWSGYDTSGDLSGSGTAQEFAFGINYYLNGHGNKLQVDAAYIDTSSDGFVILDPYAAYNGNVASGESAWLLRFQWQLGL